MDLTRDYVRNWRGIDQWQWYTAPHHAHVWQHMIRRANHRDAFWRGIPIKRGQFITSQRILAGECGVSHKVIRTVLQHLSLSGEITQKRAQVEAHDGARAGTIITICQYETYQSTEEGGATYWG